MSLSRRLLTDHPSAVRGDESLVGTRLGPFELTRILGTGGMGTVYLGEHRLIGSRVAIKVLHPRFCRDDIIVKRFFAEARAVNLIGHENIVRIIDLSLSPDGRYYYYVMEYFEGMTLAEMISSGYVPLERIAAILGQITDGLQAAHDVNIIHRDLKPANIFLIRAPDRTVVKLLDFGIAKLHALDADLHTQTGAIIGTPHYMSPEQVSGETVDARADIYSLGVILFRIATGILPFEGTTLSKILMAQLNQAVPEPRGINPEISVDYEQVILKALAKRPSARYQTMAELKAAILAAARTERAPPPGSMSATDMRIVPRPRADSDAFFSVIDMRPAFGPRRHSRHTVELEVRVRVGVNELRDLYMKDISQHGMFVRCEGDFPPLFTVVEVEIFASRSAFKVKGQVVRHVTPEQAKEWGREPGIGVQLLEISDQTKTQIENLIQATPSGPISSKPPLRPTEMRPKTKELLQRLRATSDKDPYAVLGITTTSSIEEVRVAGRRLKRLLGPEELGSEADALSAEVETLLARLNQSLEILLDPKLRAMHDAERANYLGVSQALAAGLRPDEISELRKKFVAMRRSVPDEVRPIIAAAIQHGLAGRLGEARTAYEKALAVDPLNLELHGRYWQVRRQVAAE